MQNSSKLNYFQVYKHRDRVNGVVVEQNLAISFSHDKIVRVWDMEKHEKIWEFVHGNKVYAAIVRDSQVITSCCDKIVRVLALENGEELHRLDHPDECHNIDLSPNKSLLAVACSSAVVLWDMNKLVKIKQFDLGRDVHDLRFNPSGLTLIVGLHNGEIFKIEMK